MSLYYLLEKKVKIGSAFLKKLIFFSGRILCGRRKTQSEVITLELLSQDGCDLYPATPERRPGNVCQLGGLTLGASHQEAFAKVLVLR